MADGRDIRAYALSHLGKSLLWTGSDALTIFLLVRHAGMELAAAGTLFMVLLLWNALCDVVVGRWFDRRAAAGRPALPIVAVAMPVSCLAFPASLLVPAGDGIWILACGLIFRTAFAMFDVPHNALIARLGDTPERGLQLAQLRSLGSGAASISIGLIAIPMLGEVPPSSALLGGLLLLLTLISGLLMLPYLRLAARQELMAPPPGDPVPPPARWWPDGLRGFFLASAIGMVAMGAVSKAAPHLDLASTSWGEAALLVLMIGRVAATVIAGPLAARFGASRLLAGSYLATAACTFGLAPAVSIGGPLALIWIGLTGVSIGMIALVSWVRLPVLVRAMPATSQHAQAFTFGLFTMVSKVALGASGLLLAFAFGKPLAGGPEGLMSGEALMRLCVIAGGISALAAVVLALASSTARFVRRRRGTTTRS